MYDIETKNANRRISRATYGAHEYRRGRKNRRELTHNGAFGHEKDWLHHKCVVGTTGTPRKGDGAPDTKGWLTINGTNV